MTGKRKPAPVDSDDLPPSKSQLKREAREMFDFGRSLTELPESVLKALPLDAEVLEEVLFTRSIRSNVARKRQLGFLASRLRGADLTAVIAALEARQTAARSMTARQHRVEAWRDLLVEDGNLPLQTLLASRQDVDVQGLRQLLRNALSEAKRNKPPASARKLFKMLRELDERQPLPAPPASGT
jgi:ribosome-associated protein